MYNRWERVVLGWGVGLACLGCGSNDDGGASSSGEASEFATYWADSNAWCGYMDNCELQTRSDCERFWATAAETDSAMAAANIAASELEQCEQAAHDLDACVFSAACDEFTQGCSEGFGNFDTACARIHDALRTYLNAHRKPPVSGAFFGEFYGDAAGTLAGIAESDGRVTVDVFFGGMEIAAEGLVEYDGNIKFATPASADGDPLSFQGELEGSGTTFEGGGQWFGSDDAFGFWSLTSGEE